MTGSQSRISTDGSRPARMGPLATLPVFFDLKGKRAVVAGDGEGAVWKAELLAAAGAAVEVIAPEPLDTLRHLAAEPPAGSITIIARSWTADDLAGAVVAVGALEGAEAEAFARAARAAGVPVNIVDTPGLGSFNFGTIVNRSPVAIGITTDGAAPVLGQAIRSRIEAMLHPALGTWVEAGRLWRDAIKARLPMGPQRRDLWQRFAERALQSRRPATADDLAALFSDAGSGDESGGSVVLVGAGPGDPELLTLKAVRVLQAADVILYDRLVNPAILELARREAERVSAGKTGGGPSVRQHDINAMMISYARAGKRVVRLKGGDPAIFGRANEEIAACRAAGIPVSIVPGVTAAAGAASALLVSLTDKRLAPRVQFVTGHGQDGLAPEHDWAALAASGVTTVYYMGGSTFAQMLPKLLAAGLDPDTPAAAISGATTERQHHISVPAADLPEALARLEAGVPCLIIVGRAMELAMPEMGAAVSIGHRR